MTPKEKAEKIFNDYYIICQEYTEEIQCSLQAKQCALIAIDEHMYPNPIDGSYMDEKYYEYWIDVKHEIINL